MILVFIFYSRHSGGRTNRILSAVSPRVKVEKKRVGGIGEHLSLRTEDTYRKRIKRFILFHG